MRRIFEKLLPALVLLPVIIGGNALALSDQDKQLIDKHIEEYLMRNPEKLEQALDNMQVFLTQREARLRKQALDDNADALYRNAADFSMGPADAPITIVEFFDYNCGYCKRSFAPLMEVLGENSDVRLVFKEYPILGELSYSAASTALALTDKMKYLTYHSKLMSSSSRLSQSVIDKTVSELKLPPQKIKTDARANKYTLHISATRQLAEAIGVNGTPAFVINGALFPGALEKADLTQAIVTARAELKAK
ncbi:MAG: thioredoxin domain-containing protein [Alphaproteobacteria bacterium]|nr:thioredoxin domain-containing protein [Alphaproteobacteria bacterium]